jgi:hypothetical protein
MEYLYTIYPHYPDMQNVEDWAAALHYITAKRLYEEVDLASICAGIDVNCEYIQKIIKQIETMITDRTAEYMET